MNLHLTIIARLKALAYSFRILYRDIGVAEFQDVITTRDEFRKVMGEPSELVTRKTLSHLDGHCGAFINRCPFIILSTADARGRMDVSPKGDPFGFVKIVDNKTLAIPERLGNRRADSFENILENPRIGIIFLIPGKTETLRVSGSAKIVRDTALRESMAINNKVPDFAIVVSVEEAFFHCSKCMIRSKLWQSDHWPDLDGLPRLAETMVDAGKLDLTPVQMHEIVLNDERKRLY